MKKILTNIGIKIWGRILEWFSLRLKPCDVEFILKRIAIARGLKHIHVNIDWPEVCITPISEIDFD